MYFGFHFCEMKVFDFGFSGSHSMLENRTGTSKVGAISKAQKRKVFKIVKGGQPLGFLKIQFVAKYPKIEGGTLCLLNDRVFFAASPNSHHGLF